MFKYKWRAAIFERQKIGRNTVLKRFLKQSLFSNSWFQQQQCARRIDTRTKIVFEIYIRPDVLGNEQIYTFLLNKWALESLETFWKTDID